MYSNESMPHNGTNAQFIMYREKCAAYTSILKLRETEMLSDFAATVQTNGFEL